MKIDTANASPGEVAEALQNLPPAVLHAAIQMVMAPAPVVPLSEAARAAIGSIAAIVADWPRHKLEYFVICLGDRRPDIEDVTITFNR
jgi:hypothetical protein